MSYWLQNLNPEQCAAVSHSHGPLLILAGAGSGKTTVLVSRTGRLIADKLTTPERVCVLTFTNKAANELKARVSKKLGPSAKKVWAGTFHGFGLQFLKDNWQAAGLPKKFGVIDGSDALAVLKDLMKDTKAYEKEKFVVEKVMQKIGMIREVGKTSKLDNSMESVMAEALAEKFVKRLRNLGVVDFEELLLRPLRMLHEDPELLAKTQSRYDFVMVDEFQDTNSTQMKLVDLLTGSHGNLAVVGDDDQSIYGWRGAQIRNILDFPKSHKNCEVIRLERNYRSSAKILNMANAIIATNKDRHRKVLKPGLNQEGELPELFTYDNEDMEVDSVVNELLTLQKRGYHWKDIAILYRSNSQGGMMEGGLRRSQIPYRITGGTALFDRKEAKDVLAYVRCSIYPTEVAFRRIINLPPRGIGDKTLETIEHYQAPGAREFHQRAKAWAMANPQEKAAASLLELLQFLEDLKSALVNQLGEVEPILDQQLEHLGYRRHVFESYPNPKACEARWLSVTILGRILNGMFQKFGRSMDTLEKFIDSMELRDRMDDSDSDGKDEVQMMTLHACKGLEFPLVFLLGLEEELLPHAKLGQDVDEERRLFYVGVTRAQKHLILTRVRERKRYGRVQLVSPSRFLIELDPSLYADLGQGRALKADERQSMLGDLFKKLEKKIAERDA